LACFEGKISNKAVRELTDPLTAEQFGNIAEMIKPGQQTFFYQQRNVLILLKAGQKDFAGNTILKSDLM
jgi:hypothetical protein